MGGFFGITSKRACVADVYFGADYHSHLGTHSGGLAAYDKKIGLQRKIRHIDKAPFRTQLSSCLEDMHGNAAIGCVNDTEPQPLLIRSKHGAYAVCFIGNIINKEALIKKYLENTRGHFDSMTGGKVNSCELVAAMIDQKEGLKEGLKFAQDSIEGTASIMVLTDKGSIYVARDKFGRLPVQIGRNGKGHAVSLESFPLEKLEFEKIKELGPGEIVKLTPGKMTQLQKPGKTKKICSFLWSYYGYPTSTYEGRNVEMMRYENGRLLAQRDKSEKWLKNVDYVGGVPDSGVPHAIGYAGNTKVPYARAFIKYTPTWSRSFMSEKQSERNNVAKMKQIPVIELIKNKELLFVDDSIVRGTQLQKTVKFLYDNGAKGVHMRSACPPIMYGCKYLNFMRATSDMELLTRKTIIKLEGKKGLEHMDEYADGSTKRGKKLRKTICDDLGFKSLRFQSLDNVIKAIGLKPCELCTYC